MTSEIYQPGTPVRHQDQANDSAGYILARRAEDSGNMHIIGAQGMQEITEHYTCIMVSDDGTPKRQTEISGQQAGDWVKCAAAYNTPPIGGAELAALVHKLDQITAEAAQVRATKEQERREQREAFKAEAAEKVPSWAKAALIAELDRDDCDSMADYHGHKVERRLILGFSRHTRDLFPEMRAAAAGAPETAHLTDASPEAEHRERYSMGAGYYLKNGHDNSTGWRVYKEDIGRLTSGEWRLSEPKAPATLATGGAYSIEEHTHTKKGFQMFIVVLAERVERAEFNELRDSCKAAGGWYSRAWQGTPGGFAWKDRGEAEQWARATFGGATPPDGPRPGSKATGERLRDLADGMQKKIDSALGERRENTPKQRLQAACARQVGHHMQRSQALLYALADLHESGELPAVLAHLTTKASCIEITKTIMENRPGYYDAPVDTGQPADTSEAGRAAWALLNGEGVPDRAAEELREKLNDLKNSQIPGYFPTPASVIDQMLDHAKLEDYHAVLEPSAGSGAILDALGDRDGLTVAVEVRPSLCEVLQLKGYHCEPLDFMEFGTRVQFDRVLMNPPFEKMQDIDHVRHAFEQLKSGGRLVAIMSPGPFFRTTKKAEAFRAWFEELGGEQHDLPAGAFKESGTGVASVLVVIDKP